MTESLAVRAPLRRRPSTVTAAAWLLLAASVGLYAVVWCVVMHQPFHVAEPRPHSFDLRVYRAAARAVLKGRQLYALRLYHGLGFTYPPIAALLLVPNLLLSRPADTAVIAAINIVMLVAIIRLAPRLQADPRRADGRAPAWRWPVVAAVAAVALWLEPVSMAIGYGQIDLAVTLLVVWDLARPRGAMARGAGVGLAAGIKLTPLLFIPYLLLARDRRAALSATASFLATVAVGFAVLPADSVRFWGTTFLKSSRAGDIAAPINQSLFGAIARTWHTQQVDTLGTVIVAAAGVAGLILAVRAARRGQDGVGFAVCALTSLLVSPISWTHHWVLAIPAVVLLATWAVRERRWVVVGAVGLLTLVTTGYLPEGIGHSYGLGYGPLGLWADPYVVLACVAIIAATVVSPRSVPATCRR